jgi:CBS domain-containing protein
MGRTRVRDVMTTDVAAVPLDSGYREIIDLLDRRRIRAVPVLDADRRVVGVVSEADLLAKLEFTAPLAGRPALVARRRRDAPDKAAADRAGDLMTTPAVTTGPQASLPAAARTMAEADVKLLPVVDGDGVLLGVVSARDLLRVHRRPDARLRAEVLDDVLWEWFRVRPPQVDVAVRGGVVTLHGWLDRRRQVDLAVRLARGVDGVVDVRDELTYRTDDRVAGVTHAQPG